VGKVTSPRRASFIVATKQQTSDTYWTALDGLRAVAVGIVLLAHAGFPYPKSGGVGVDIFFVLSGFLITGILHREYSRYGDINKKAFYIRRLLRLSPALLACVLLFAALSMMSTGCVSVPVIALVLSYTSNWSQALFGADMKSMAHCWSLAIEEQYYLIWPFAIYLLERNVRSASTKCLVLVCLSLVLALYRAAMVGTYSAARIYFGLDTHMDGLVMGSALAYLVIAVSAHRSERCVRIGLRFLSAAAIPACIVGLMLLMHLITWGNPWMGRLGYTLVAFASCLIIADLVASPFSWLRGILEFSAFVYVGKISYGLYLYHFPIFQFVEQQYGALPRAYMVAVMVFTTFVIAVVSYHCMELPILRLKGRFKHCPKSAIR